MRNLESASRGVLLRCPLWFSGSRGEARCDRVTENARDDQRSDRTTAEAATVTPMNIIESGPAAGVVGVQALTRQIGIDKAISFDMGGTTAKASIIENGALSRALDYSVGGGVMIGSRLLSGAGYTLKVPAIDLAEVGAGGGSLIR